MAALKLAIDRCAIFLKTELVRLIRFFLIGAASLVLTILLYGFCTRSLWPAGSHTLIYVFVTCLVSGVNFEANRIFTFRVHPNIPGLRRRFVAVAILALGFNSLLFWLGHDVLHLWDFGVLILNPFLVALFTFTAHSLFTFHPRPWRHVQSIRRSLGW